MAYTAPTIGVAGLTIPTYDDVLNLFLDSFRNIYGQTVYLENDSADFQWISVLALALSDEMQLCQLEYNNRAPNFAIGAALDSLIKINGLTRKPATFSTCNVTLTGVAGTVITNGVVRDINGISWVLPGLVTIGVGGTVTVTATCSVIGTVNAIIGQITFILTPTAGWTSVNNLTPASVGQPIESDAQLRARQADSTEAPSITILAGTVAAIARTLNVTRYNVLENNTSVPDSFGNPPHSITSVIEGGADADVAQAIYLNRGIGAFTNGTTTVVVTDPNTGITMPISFSRPLALDIHVELGIHSLSSSFTSSTVDTIRTLILNYLNNLQIGEDITISALYAVAMLATPNIVNPTFTIRTLLAGIGSATGPTDIPVAFNQVSSAISSNIVINLF